MKRIFGTAKKLPPPPTLDETAGKISDKGDKVDDKIKGLDEQLARFKDQLKKTRPGPAQEAIKRRALQVTIFLSHWGFFIHTRVFCTINNQHRFYDLSFLCIIFK